MIVANHGHLVCISSVAGLFGTNGLADYPASKFTAAAVAQSIFLELNFQRKSKVKTTIVCPYFIKTAMFEGCTTKYPFSLPLLDLEFVVQSIVNAILEEQYCVLIPKSLCGALFFKHLVSSKIHLACGQYLGIDMCMAACIQREKESKDIPC